MPSAALRERKFRPASQPMGRRAGPRNLRYRERYGSDFRNSLILRLFLIIPIRQSHIRLRLQFKYAIKLSETFRILVKK